MCLERGDTKKQEYKNPQERNRSEVSKPRIEKILEKRHKEVFGTQKFIA
jgi:hypothetical protein